MKINFLTYNINLSNRKHICPNSRLQNNNQQNIYFTGNGDVFNYSMEITPCSKLAPSKVESIILATKAQEPVASGSTADFFKIGEYGVKKSSDFNILKKETQALKYLSKNGISNVTSYKALGYYGGYGYLITDILPGKNPQIANNAFNNGQIKSLMDTFYHMDKTLFLHYDLNPGNILTNGNKASVIDFGCFNIIDDDGKFSTSINTNNNFNINLSTKDRLKKSFFNYNYLTNLGFKNYQWNYTDNPGLPICSNVVNFEFRCLSEYLSNLEKLDQNKAKEFYKGFLQHKADFSSQRANYFEQLAQSMPDNQEKNLILQGIKYDRATANVLQNPSDIVMQIEQSKMDIKALLFEKLFNNKNESNINIIVKQTYNKMIDCLNKLISDDCNECNKIYAKGLMQIYKNEYWQKVIKQL